MDKDLPKLTVVIPTRERADTLIHTLRTVSEQKYANLEIIVSDNASSDNTKEVVESFKDKRIRYTTTERRIGMSENWEHALALITGEYVMYLGDDDGLLPDACSEVANLIIKYSTKAIIWKKPDYTWPNVKSAPNQLSLSIDNKLIEMQGKILVKAIAKGRTSYGRLPIIYSGFVSMAIVQKIKDLDGKFFHSITPDVYSGIVLANEIDKYLYSTRPFSINGGSQHSNGINSIYNKNAASNFFQETTIPIHQSIPVIKGSIQSSVAEAFMQAFDRGLVGNIPLDRKRVFSNIFGELCALDINLKTEGLRQLAALSHTGLKNLVQKELVKMENQNHGTGNSYGWKKINGNCALNINCNHFKVNNSFDACQLIDSLIGSYESPEKVIKANNISFILLYLSRLVKNKLENYILPF